MSNPTRSRSNCELAQDVHGNDGARLLPDAPKIPPDIPPAPEIGVLGDRTTDPVSALITMLIEDLPHDARIDLVTLMRMGREDRADWAQLRAEALRVQTAEAARSLIKTPLLANHLTAGLAAIGHSCCNWENRAP